MALPNWFNSTPGGTSVVSGGAISGSWIPITSGQIGTAAVVAGDLGSGAVQSGQIAFGAVNSGEIASGQIGSSHLSNFAVGSGQIGAGSVNSFNLGSGAVTSGKVGNGAVVSGSIASGQIGNSHLASGDVVNYWNIASGAITTGRIGAGMVQSGQVASGSLGGTELASGAVQSGHVGDGAVVSGSIASGQIGLDHLASGVLANPVLTSGIVQSGNIGNGAVNSGNIASGQIGTDHLASGVMFALSSGCIVSGMVGNGAVVSGSIASGQIGTNHLASGVIPASAVTRGLFGYPQLGDRSGGWTKLAYPSLPLAGNLVTNIAVAANYCYCSRAWFADKKIDKFMLYYSAAVTSGTKVYLGIYSNDNNYPGTKIFQAGPYNTTAVALEIEASGWTPTIDTPYWTAVCYSALSANTYSFTYDNTSYYLRGTISSGVPLGTNMGMTYVSWAYNETSGLPAVMPTGGAFANTNGGMPWVVYASGTW
jgi:hypothetical protein